MAKLSKGNDGVYGREKHRCRVELLNLCSPGLKWPDSSLLGTCTVTLFQCPNNIIN